ncbi:CLUMA_CG005105, isoform A [Clunio marinus]|uniref:Large ribosomal subunit protein uL30m n=1 Tax=Clunio marinus TaxID=568069 RepID=A0A1J1HZ82_9DIPT|nr:CLUMA_CG005105, isoform A [Clunio marinus]
MNNICNFLKIKTPFNTLCRSFYYKNKINKKYLYKDGKNITGTINYYPKNDNDPILQSLEESGPEEPPPKMFRVTRIKRIQGNPFWERRILRELGLFERPNVAVIKNIPENNARMWKVKHLIKITPIRFPYGEPTEEDLKYTQIKENGDCIVIKNIDTLNKRVEATEKFKKDVKRLDDTTLKKDSRMKWLNPW